MDQTALDLVRGEVERAHEAPGDFDVTTIRRPSGNTTEEAATNVVQLPAFRQLTHRPSEFFAAIQEWEGAVTAVFDDHFAANLYDVAGKNQEMTEIADISFDDIDPADRGRVTEGAIFRWLIGHSRTRSGQFSRKWVIYFRRALSKPPEASVFSRIAIPENLKSPLN
jgi:hypothetical protein